MSLNAISGIGNNLMNSIQTAVKDGAATGAEEAKDNKAIKLEASKSSAVKKTSFLDKLVSVTNQTKPKPTQAQMEDSLAALRAKGKVVLHHPLDKTVKSYVKELKDFLGDIRDHAYQSKTRDEHYQGIEIADAKLDALAEDLLSTEKAELALMESLGRLQGLIIDIYV